MDRGGMGGPDVVHVHFQAYVLCGLRRLSPDMTRKCTSPNLRFLSCGVSVTVHAVRHTRGSRMGQDGEFKVRSRYSFADGWLTQQCEEWTARARAWPDPQIILTYLDPHGAPLEVPEGSGAVEMPDETYIYDPQKELDPLLWDEGLYEDGPWKVPGRTYFVDPQVGPDSALWDLDDGLLRKACRMAEWSLLEESCNVPVPLGSGQLVLKGFRPVRAESDCMRDPEWLDQVRDRAALRAFWATIPPAIQQELLLAETISWLSLVVFSRLPHTVDLSRSNRRLFECLIRSCDQMIEAAFFGRVGALAKGKQASIMEDAGLPAGESARRMLSRFTANPCRWNDYNEIMWTLEQHPEIRRIVQHLPVINNAVQYILHDARWFPNMTGPLLCEIARIEDDESSTFYYTVFRDAIELIHRAGWSDRKIYSIRQLVRLHDYLVEHLDPEMLMREDERDYVFPTPPYAGTAAIVPLTSPEELFREGAEMHHCAAICSHRVATHLAFLYRVMKPVRATLELARDDCGRWRLSQMSGKCNEPIGQHIMDMTVAALFASPTSETAQPRIIPK